MKNILVVSYSQSGQLDEILDNFLIPLQAFHIERVRISPKDEYPFPWTSESFFDLMPETVLEEPIALAPFSFERDQYDLVILGYQPWYLSPSQPTTALLQSESFRNVLKDTPVATVIGSRNMWINAQKSIVRDIDDAGGKLVANIPLIDRVQNHISALTILHWMLTGKKTRRWGFLPLPGVSQEDIIGAKQYGEPLAEALRNNMFHGVQEKILDKGGISIAPSIIFIEARAKKLFMIWANLIKRKGTTPKKRAFYVSFFKYYLVFALFVVSPFILIVYFLLRPLFYSKIKKDREQILYLGINRAQS